MSVPPPVSSTLTSGSVPVAAGALEPAWVRHGSASTQKSYQTALAFEDMLVEQLSQSLTASSGLGGEAGQSEALGEEGSSGSSASPFSSMLPQALTSGVMDAGGLGLAAQMTRQLEGTSGASHSGLTGGTSPAPAPSPSATEASALAPDGAANTTGGTPA